MAPVDRRDDQTWVTLELTVLGSLKIEDGTFEEDLLEDLGAPLHWPIFVPSKTYRRGGKKIIIHLVEGYVFVGTGYPDSRYFDLEHSKSKLVKQVMSTDNLANRMRVLHTIPNSKIIEWEEKLQKEVSQNLQIGDRVRILEGILTNLEGVVVELDFEYAYVCVTMRSAEFITQCPRCSLEIL